MSALSFIRSGEYIGARELRERFAQVIRSHKPFFVTEHGKPVKVVVPYGDFLELLEAVEELKDLALIREMAQGRGEYAKGSFKSLASLKKLFGDRG
jgi:prevent-host-death family protein